jgi:hypothetical protein
MPSSENRIENECTNQFLSTFYWEYWNELGSKKAILWRLYLGETPTDRAETCCVCSELTAHTTEGVFEMNNCVFDWL